MKIVIIGSARHGKDTVAEFLNEMFDYKFKSSSQAASEIFLYDKLKEKYGYKTHEECFEDRVNHRKEWHDEIVKYNTPDKSRLAKDIMKTNDIYVGMRSDEELRACIAEGVFDFVVDVFDPRKPLEPKDSFNIDVDRWSNYRILNDGSLLDLSERVYKMMIDLYPEEYELIPINKD